ncbi:MAG: hypothetical protein HEQ22_13015 [Sphingopyxis sp.]|uniref:hypothetical protein n=1 Tax=Sphingopyxis sp. TaxID=1908224 RepID=UPI003D80C129
MTGGAIGARAVGDGGARSLPGEWSGAPVHMARMGERRAVPGAASDRRVVARRP